MYYYTITEGCYSDYSATFIIHERQFNLGEFLTICGKAGKKAQSKLWVPGNWQYDCGKTKEEVNVGSMDLIHVLVAEYGFIGPKVLVCHVGDYETRPEDFEIKDE